MVGAKKRRVEVGTVCLVLLLMVIVLPPFFRASQDDTVFGSYSAFIPLVAGLSALGALLALTRISQGALNILFRIGLGFVVIWAAVKSLMIFMYGWALLLKL